ncbi:MULTISPECIES: hypothetical protein [unclassified Paenibacillus]|uniref:hypothetical protein n=1 Tax=unclassified Paenibacillus TaxID=185978 RepID=UPI0008995E89|nr:MULTISPECIES: hypothetical protein [unclassified Paenibacillus]MCM3130979.1 hypothetical protein [Paenibacillus sp. MER 78]SDX04681.1 hypothetical protein SAMN05518848_104182 [Paenibacillus sp. PDC88]
MQVKIRYVPQHKEKGYFLDINRQPTEDCSKAIRFKSPFDDYAEFMMGRYRPDNPLDFWAAPLRIEYDVVDGAVDIRHILEEKLNEHLRKAD